MAEARDLGRARLIEITEDLPLDIGADLSGAR
jgi:hypothetical protein